MTGPSPLSWLRQAITERLELAREGQPDPADSRTGEWIAYGHHPGPEDQRQDRDVQMVGAETDETGWKVCEVGQWDRAAFLAAHIAANDPRDVIARCEAELGILDLYAATAALVQSPPVMPEGHPYAGKISARDYMDARRELCVLEPVVSFLAAGYRFHPGYAEAGWGT